MRNVRASTNTPFMLTVDVEPDWGIAGHECILQTLPRFNELLRTLRIPATFFVVAGLIDQCGEVLRRELQNCEVASHGLTHRVLAELSQDEVERELSQSRRKLEDFFGRPVTGFRAPFLKVPPNWFNALEKAGYRYDSSMGKVSPSPANVPPSRWKIEKHGGIVEIPVTSLRSGWFPLSLTYLRLLAPVGIRMVAPDSAIMYLHLHELADPALAKSLPWPLRTLLRRNAGEPAWTILEQILTPFAARANTCAEVIHGY